MPIDPLKLTPMQRFAAEARAAGETRAVAAAKAGVTSQAIKKRLARARKRMLRTMSRVQRSGYLRALNSGRRQHRIRPISLSFVAA